MWFRKICVLAASALLVGSIAAATATTSAEAAPGPEFVVMNTSESPPDGVYFRNSPYWSDTMRIYGLGVFMNERVELQCYAFGEAVGPYNNSLWYYAANVTRPMNSDGHANKGMLNAHYINDGRSANQVVTGVPACANNRPPETPVNPPAPDAPPIGKSVVYYSGKGAAGSAQAQKNGADRILTENGTYDDQWTPSNHCVPDKGAVNFGGKDINRLAGWSLGRLGPIYALKYMKDHGHTAQARRINYVILFDPGSRGAFGECDYDQKTVKASETLAWWLALSDDNRLVILSGNDTASNRHETIQEAYFPAIKTAGSSLRKRVLVCNYSLSHKATYETYSNLMKSGRRPTVQGFNSCPKQGAAQVWGWNP